MYVCGGACGDILIRNLWLVMIFCTTCAFGVLLFHVSRIFGSVLVDLIVRKRGERVNSIQSFARRGLLGRSVGLSTMVTSAVLKLFMEAIRTVIYVAYILSPFIVLSVELALVQLQWGGMLHFLSELTAGDYSVFQGLRGLVILPLAILAQAGLFLAPLYNMVVFVLVHFPISVLTWILRGMDPSTFASGLLSILLACSNFVTAFAAFIVANKAECVSAVLQARSNCTLVGEGVGVCSGGSNLPAYSVAALQCLDFSVRRIDLSKTTLVAQRGLIQITRSIASVDATFGQVINVVLYPFTDTNFWLGVSEGVNAVLGVVGVMPTTTVARCGLASLQAVSQGTSLRLAMCTPDLGPSFDCLVSAFRYLGSMLNGWFNMLYVVIVLGGDAPCPAGIDMASVFADPTWRGLSGSNQTVLVRLSDTMFARTDGATVVYVSHRSQITYSYGAWPTPVDVSIGIAGVQLPAGSVSGMGLLGCVCVDGAAGVSIDCTLLSPEQESWTVPVRWQLPTAPLYMTCKRLRVVVQSLRWPDHRVSISSLGISGSCVLAGTCIAADAAIYAVPVCGGTGINGLECMPGDAFKGSNCFPYCMALRLVGSSVIQPLIMRGANSWSTGVLLSERNCASNSGVLEKDGANTIICDYTGTTAEATTSAGAINASTACTYSKTCHSWVSDRATVMGTGFSAAVADSDSGIRIVLSGQPLVIAGGVQMRLAASIASTTSHYFSVDFPHLVGDQYNAFTMEVSMTAGIPCSPPPPVASLNLQYERLGMIDVPPVDVDRKQW